MIKSHGQKIHVVADCGLLERLGGADIVVGLGDLIFGNAILG